MRRRQGQDPAPPRALPSVPFAVAVRHLLPPVASSTSRMWLEPSLEIRGERAAVGCRQGKGLPTVLPSLPRLPAGTHVLMEAQQLSPALLLPRLWHCQEQRKPWPLRTHQVSMNSVTFFGVAEGWTRTREVLGSDWPQGSPRAAPSSSPAPAPCGCGAQCRAAWGCAGKSAGGWGPAPALSLPLTICHSIRAGRQLRGCGERGWGSATPHTTACCLADEKKFKC